MGHLYATSLAGEVYRLGESGGTLTKASIGWFTQPVSVAAAPGVTDEFFIAEKPGRVVRWTPSGTSEVIDIRSIVADSGEQGLLSVAVAPDYATSGRLFLFYNDSGGDLQVDELRGGVRAPVLTIQHDRRTTTTAASSCSVPTARSTSRRATAAPRAIRRATPRTRAAAREDPADGGECLGAAPAARGDADLAAPTLAVRVPRRQRVLRLRGAVAYVRCSEACTVEAGGTLRIGSRRLLLRRAAGSAEPSPSARMKVRLRKRSARILRRALANGRRPRVQVRLRARDAAGNRSGLIRRLGSRAPLAVARGSAARPGWWPARGRAHRRLPRRRRGRAGASSPARAEWSR